MYIKLQVASTPLLISLKKKSFLAQSELIFGVESRDALVKRSWDEEKGGSEPDNFLLCFGPESLSSGPSWYLTTCRCASE